MITKQHLFLKIQNFLDTYTKSSKDVESSRLSVTLLDKILITSAPTWWL